MLGEVTGLALEPKPDGTLAFAVQRAVVPEELAELATVGALLRYEEIAHSRGMVDKPLTIQFVPKGGARVAPYAIDRPEESGEKVRSDGSK